MKKIIFIIFSLAVTFNFCVPAIAQNSRTDTLPPGTTQSINKIELANQIKEFQKGTFECRNLSGMKILGERTLPDTSWQSLDKSVKSIKVWVLGSEFPKKTIAHIRIGCFASPEDARKMLEELNGMKGGLGDLLRPGSFSGRVIGDASWKASHELGVTLGNLAFYFSFSSVEEKSIRNLLASHPEFLTISRATISNYQFCENTAVAFMKRFAGNRYMSQQKNLPQIKSIKVDPETIGLGKQARITIVAEDPKDEPLKYQWYDGHTQGGAYGQWSSQEAVLYYGYTEGKFPVEVSVINANGLMSFGKTEIMVVSKVISDEEKKQAENALQRLKQPAVVVKNWHDSHEVSVYNEDMYERNKAVLSIMDYGDASAVPLLLEHIGEKYNLVVRQNALRALGEVGTAEVIPVLDEFLKKPITGFDIGDDEITKNILIRHCEDAIRKIKKG